MPPSHRVPFGGSCVRAYVSGGVTVSEFLYDAGTELGPHQHEGAFLSLTLAGSYVEQSGSHCVEPPAGSASFHPPRREHSLLVGARGLHSLNIDVHPECTRRLEEVGTGELRPLVDIGGPLAWLTARLHEEVSAWSATSPLVAEGLVLEMLGVVGRLHCLRVPRREPPWIAALDEILRREMHRRVTVTELAARMGVHPVHLSRTWRQFRSCSIHDSLHRARIESACRRLSAGATSLAAVAVEVGFADQTHFTRVFKQCTGMTPGAYRARFAGADPEREAEAPLPVQ